MSLEDVLNDIDAQNDGNFEAFEAEAFEEISNYSRQLKRQGIPPVQRKQLVTAKMASIVANKKIGGTPQAVAGRVAANFDIILYSDARDSAIGSFVNMPVMLFGASQMFSGYPDINSAGIQSSSPVDKITTGLGHKSYTEFGNIGTKQNVQIKCTQVPYNSLVMGTLERPIKISKMRLKVESGNESQLTVAIKLYKKTMFGTMSIVDLPSSASSFSPMQYQSLIVDIDGEYTVDKDCAIVIDVKGEGGKQLTTSLSMFITQ